jgi:hypothetical protein
MGTGGWCGRIQSFSFADYSAAYGRLQSLILSNPLLSMNSSLISALFFASVVVSAPAPSFGATLAHSAVRGGVGFGASNAATNRILGGDSDQTLTLIPQANHPFKQWISETSHPGELLQLAATGYNKLIIVYNFVLLVPRSDLAGCPYVDPLTSLVD